MGSLYVGAAQESLRGSGTQASQKQKIVGFSRIQEISKAGIAKMLNAIAKRIKKEVKSLVAPKS